MGAAAVARAQSRSSISCDDDNGNTTEGASEQSLARVVARDVARAVARTWYRDIVTLAANRTVTELV